MVGEPRGSTQTRRARANTEWPVVTRDGTHNLLLHVIGQIRVHVKSLYVLRFKTSFRNCHAMFKHFLFVVFNVAPVCCSSRYGLAVLSCYGFFVVYTLRVNLSVAMVDMLNNTHKSSANHSGSLCPAHHSPTRPKHKQTVSWKMSVEEDLKYNIRDYLCYDT